MAIPKLSYTMVSTADALDDAVHECMSANTPTALDFETTSLYPKEGRVRLVSLCNSRSHYLVDFDGIAGGFRAVANWFEGGRWVVFNAGFEDRWFADAGADVHCFDVDNLRAAIAGGGRHSLKLIAHWDLKREMDKTQQVSDWNKPILEQKQLDYAYEDADITWALWELWMSRCDDDQYRAFELINGQVPAVIEMEEAGMKLDTTVHTKLVKGWYEQKMVRVNTLRTMVGKKEVSNLASAKQWSDYFSKILPDQLLEAWPRTEKTGTLQIKNEVLKRYAGLLPDTPIETCFDALADYKTIDKYLSAFGTPLIESVRRSEDGRIHPRFNIAAARTCRYSSSGPNVQQTPRDRELLQEDVSVRSSFVAEKGNLLVSFDYSGIELRVLGLLSEDEQLIEDMVTGDLHAEVASMIAGYKIDKSTPEGYALRTAAKGVSFGIIYGSGAGGLASTMRKPIGEAQAAIDHWTARYPKAFQYRHVMMDEATATRRIRCADGGTIYMGTKPTMPRCANYPVQRAAWSCMARAIIRHKQSLDQLRNNPRPGPKEPRMLASIHDALIDEAPKRKGKQIMQLMEEDMTAGFLDIFPGASTERLLEGGTGTTWSNLG